MFAPGVEFLMRRAVMTRIDNREGRIFLRLLAEEGLIHRSMVEELMEYADAREVRFSKNSAAIAAGRRDHRLPGGKITPERGDRLPAHRDDALLLSLAPHLYLVVAPSNKLKISILAIAYYISCFVQPRSWLGTERVGNKSLCRQVWSVQISSCQSCSSQVQLPHYP